MTARNFMEDMPMKEFWKFLFSLICAIEGEDEIEERPRSPPSVLP